MLTARPALAARSGLWPLMGSDEGSRALSISRFPDEPSTIPLLLLLISHLLLTSALLPFGAGAAVLCIAKQPVSVSTPGALPPSAGKPTSSMRTVGQWTSPVLKSCSVRSAVRCGSTTSTCIHVHVHVQLLPPVPLPLAFSRSQSSMGRPWPVRSSHPCPSPCRHHFFPRVLVRARQGHKVPGWLAWVHGIQCGHPGSDGARPIGAGQARDGHQSRGHSLFYCAAPPSAITQFIAPDVL